MKRLTERLAARHVVFRGRAVGFSADRVRLPGGGRAVREYLEHPGAAAVLPFVDARTVLMVRQFRYPVGRAPLEIPAGKLEPGEDPRICARRELAEEAGCRARHLIRLTSYWPTPAFSTEVIHVFAARDLAPCAARPDDDENLKCISMPFKEVLRMVRAGSIRDSKTIIAVLLWAARGK